MSFDFNAWWEAMGFLEKMFWGLAIPFSVFFLIQLTLTFIGGDVPEDGDVDADIEADDGIAFQFFTLKNLVAFFTIFSWTGIACLDSGLSDGISLLIATIAGLVMMTIMASLFYALSKAVESGTLKMNNAVGSVGEVYMEIQPKRGNIGKVQVTVQGSLRTLEALTDSDILLRPGMVVDIVGITSNNQILIVNKSA